jgi:hypothetical protein
MRPIEILTLSSQPCDDSQKCHGTLREPAVASHDVVNYPSIGRIDKPISTSQPECLEIEGRIL